MRIHRIGQKRTVVVRRFIVKVTHPRHLSMLRNSANLIPARLLFFILNFLLW